jgi:hypothetical protein
MMSLSKKHPNDAGGRAHTDLVAVERYEYLLATAQPDTLNKVHAEAFRQLAGAQLDLLYRRFTENASSDEERPIDASPDTLARVATDTEVARPGSLAHILGPQGEPNGSGSLLGTIGRLIVASPLVTTLFPYTYGAGTGLWPEDADEGQYL